MVKVRVRVRVKVRVRVRITSTIIMNITEGTLEPHLSHFWN
jgi:hypothetical protein